MLPANWELSKSIEQPFGKGHPQPSIVSGMPFAGIITIDENPAPFTKQVNTDPARHTTWISLDQKGISNDEGKKEKRINEYGSTK